MFKLRLPKLKRRERNLGAGNVGAGMLGAASGGLAGDAGMPSAPEDLSNIDALSVEVEELDVPPENVSGAPGEDLGDVTHPVEEENQPAPVVKRPPRLGDYLVDTGLITPEAVKAALFEQKVTGDPLGTILVRNGFLTYKDMVRAVIDLTPNKVMTEKVQSCRIPYALLEENQINIAAETDETVYAATLGSEDVCRRIVGMYYPGYSIEVVPLSPEHMEDFLERMEMRSEQVSENLSDEDMLDNLLHKALELGVSDIHIEPRLKSYTVLFRRLGVREIHHEGSLEEYYTMSAQVKDRSKMDLAERRLPQDGGFQIESNGKLIDMRVATDPTVDGEKIVIRVLDPDRVQPRLDRLGISRVDDWRKGFSRLNGICLICGQTGSGKTTTLNATVREMNRIEKAIYTMEDPVEYRVAYTAQTSANPAIGLDFARGVKAFMRADPDVIILGEVRDPDTARNAVKAADTGHLVLATLHTGSILGAVSRLRDLDIPPNELRYLLRAVMVQTLVRTLCLRCQGKGCEACNQSGYGSRAVVTECQYFSNESEVQRLLNGEKWWPTLVEDGIRLYRENRTDLKELRRVFGSEVDDLLGAEAQVDIQLLEEA